MYPALIWFMGFWWMLETQVPIELIAFRFGACCRG
jgi:hypothetical protein